MTTPRRSRRLAGLEPEIIPTTNHVYKTSVKSYSKRESCLDYLVVSVGLYFIYHCIQSTIQLGVSASLFN